MHVLLGYLSLHSIQFRFIFVQFSTCVYYPLQSKPKKEKYIKIWKWHYPFRYNLFSSSLDTTNFTPFKKSK